MGLRMSQPSAAVPVRAGRSDRDAVRRAQARREWPLAIFCCCVAGVALLVNLFGSPDILTDEAAYTWAAQQVAQGWHLTLSNQAFFVHPPLMFLLQAGWLRLTGQAGAAMPSAIRTARVLAAGAGVANVLLVAGLAYRLAANAGARRRRVLTGAIALLTALDPVLVRYDRQDVIEPFALCASLLVLHAAWGLRRQPAVPYVSVTSLLIGLSLLTNQITIFVIAVPLLFALLQRDAALIRRSAAALAIGLVFSQVFLLWSMELGLGGDFVSVQTANLRRLVGLLQISGLNAPGVSLAGSLERSVTQYSSSYVVLASGFAAFVWCWTRRNGEHGNFLTAWLTASYAFGTYIAAVGTLNEQFFVYLMPATIVGTVLCGDALVARWSSPAAGATARAGAGIRLLPLLAGTVSFGALACLSAASWSIQYLGPGDGVVQIDRLIGGTLPRCAAVNASGDTEKFSYLLDGRPFADYSVGAAALANGVHYYILAPEDATESTGNMSPALGAWIRQNGRQLAIFPSQTYDTVQLWYVPASTYDPAADVMDVSGGAFVNTVGSHCGGYTVTNGTSGSFYSGYQALGGKSVVGAPMSRVSALSGGAHEQLFDGAVLASGPGSGSAVQPVPVVTMLSDTAPAAYEQDGLPPVVPDAATALSQSWLTNPAITRAYLGGRADTGTAYAAAVRRYGEPLGPPALAADGTVSQAFADVVLQTSAADGGVVHAAAVTQDALKAGVLRSSDFDQAAQAAPALPNPDALGPAQPTSVAPFVATLGAALVMWGLTILLAALIGNRRQRRQRARLEDARRERVGR
jgi:hypothetical protein